MQKGNASTADTPVRDGGATSTWEPIAAGFVRFA
jgi:hypothetical protein